MTTRRKGRRAWKNMTPEERRAELERGRTEVERAHAEFERVMAELRATAPPEPAWYQDRLRIVAVMLSIALFIGPFIVPMPWALLVIAAGVAAGVLGTTSQALRSRYWLALAWIAVFLWVVLRSR
jgi:hypothetical protein